MLARKIEKNLLQYLLVTCVLALGACSSDEEQAEEPVANEEGGENQSNNESENSEGNNESSGQGENQAEANEDASASNETQGEGNATANTLGTNVGENTENTAPAAESSVPPPVATAPAPEAPAAAAAPEAPAAAAAPTPAADTGGIGPQPNRFVRYVKVTSATVHAEPNETSASVVTLVKGDHILVSEENGWGKIADGRYIKLSDLSNKGVPRDRTPLSWN
jgi:hypothetical protein